MAGTGTAAAAAADAATDTIWVMKNSSLQLSSLPSHGVERQGDSEDSQLKKEKTPHLYTRID
jgi:hypothetical protein